LFEHFLLQKKIDRTYFTYKRTKFLKV
jgi:hypothetical protein